MFDLVNTRKVCAQALDENLDSLIKHLGEIPELEKGNLIACRAKDIGSVSKDIYA